MKLCVTVVLALLLASPAAASDFDDCKAIVDAEQRLACFDALKPEKVEAAPKDVSFPIHTRIIGPFKKWERGTRFKLENKQVWVAVEGRGYYPGIPDNPEVTISETALGAYWLKVAGTGGLKIKVKRIK